MQEMDGWINAIHGVCMDGWDLDGCWMDGFECIFIKHIMSV